MPEAPTPIRKWFHPVPVLFGTFALGGMVWANKSVPVLFWFISIALSLPLLFGVACLSEYGIRRRTIKAPTTGKPMHQWFQFHLSTAVILMLAAGVLIGAERWYWRRHVPRVTLELERIETADPIADADANADFTAKNYRLLGVRGEGERFPGICKGLKGKYEYPGIDGTGCCGPQPWHMEYAEVYNHRMSEKLLSLEAKLKP